MELKTCKQCKKGLPKDRTHFHVNNERKDGFSSKCKDCVLCKGIKDFYIEEWYDKRSSKFKESWTFEDIKWLYDNYLLLDKQEILNHFNRERSYKTITNVVYKWGLRKIEKNDGWSEKEIKLLRKHYPHLSQDKLEFMFPQRTWVSIKMKASKLKITRSEEMLHKIKSECQIGKTISLAQRQKTSERLRGANNYNWKGGISPIVVRLREYTIPWKIESLARYDYKCALSNLNDGTLEVHHQNKNFSELVYETFKILNLKIEKDMSNYTEVERNLIRDTLLSLHYECGLGIPLTKNIHKKFHNIYGNRSNNLKQFNEFKNRYESGEFDDLVIGNTGGVKIG